MAAVCTHGEEFHHCTVGVYFKKNLRLSISFHYLQAAKSPSWEADIRTPSKEIPGLSWNPKVHFSPYLESVECSPHLHPPFKFHFNIISSFMLGDLKRSVSYRVYE
jgi:hypothetical protein